MKYKCTQCDKACEIEIETLNHRVKEAAAEALRRERRCDILFINLEEVKND